MRKLLTIIPLSILLITGCQTESPTEKPSQVTEEIEVGTSMSNYFLPNKTKAHYKGDGNEFATFDIEVTTINHRYTIIDEDNGGVLLRKIYRIKENRIEMLSEEPIDFDEEMPTINELDKLQSSEIYLQKPFEVGTTFENWEVIETGLTVETPYQTFHDVFVIQSSEESFTNKKYFAKDFGEIKRESIYSDEENDFIVTSILEDITD